MLTMSDRMILPQDLLTEAKELSGELNCIRQRLHREPELSGQEWETCQFIRSELAKLKLMPEPSFSPPHTVALLHGELPGPCIALRADIDALPIHEQNNVPYRSCHSGVMHACGHDAHTAMLLGATRLLVAHRQELHGAVKLIFQSSEEKFPSGAKDLTERGVLRNPPVEMIFAQHVQSHIPCGKMGVYTGGFMAASDEFRLVVTGKSCHAGHPERGVDAISVAAQIITALQTLISRETAPVMSAALSIGTISGGERANIIADTVTMTGTLRTLDETVRTKLRRRIAELSSAVARGMGGDCQATFEVGYPCVNNDATAAEHIRMTASAVLGAENVFVPATPSTGSEDFAWYLQEVPGVMVHIGCGNSNQGIISPIHTPTFDIDPDCLPLGAAVLAYTVLKYCT